MMKIENRILEAAEQFNLRDRLITCQRYGNGHINETYLLNTKTEDGAQKRYILQAVNSSIFKDISAVMENILHVTEYLKTKAEAPDRMMHVIKTKDDRPFYIDREGIYWRLYNYVEDSLCLELPENLDDFYQSAVAFGKFQHDLNDFPAETLHVIIPDFHNTPKRYRDFLRAVEQDSEGRAASVSEEIDFINQRASFYPILLESNKKGDLPLRVSHNDTKCNNALLDCETHKALCVIDLDTIMPGFSVTDFGDSIRFGASTAAEDETDLSKVKLDMEKFNIYTKGFLDGCGGLLTDSEIMLLPEGAKMMTIECGMRFLTDYLEGDHYFRTSRPNHNLDRCRTQLKLVREMEEKWDEMKDCVKRFLK